MAENEPAYSVHAIHLVRTAVQANLTLSQMADQKASMLLAATLVVFTISIGQAGSGPHAPALLVLALFAFLAALCAILAVVPLVANPAKRPDEANLLFFSAFSDLDEAEFCNRLLPRLTSDEDVFRVMLRDLHQNGQVLQRKKYRWLGRAYWLFLTGLVLAGLTLVAINLPAISGL